MDRSPSRPYIAYRVPGTIPISVLYGFKCLATNYDIFSGVYMIVLEFLVYFKCRK